jgi:sugar phosphate isomerase/epimerase
MHSRRDFGRLVLGGATLAGLGGAGLLAGGPARAAAPKINYTVDGVKLGVCLYCFRDMPRPDDQSKYTDMMVDAAVRSGGGLVEVNSPYFEPRNDLPFQGLPLTEAELKRPAPGTTNQKWATMSWADLQAQRAAQRRWRIDNGPAAYADVRRRMEDKGLTLFSYVITFTSDMTDPELDATFKSARALGVKTFSTNQTKVEMASRLKPFAERYGMDLGFHNHTAVDDPNEVASAAGLEKLFAMSPRFKSNLDTGHFVAGNQDPYAFLMSHADRVTHLHMKDRKRDNGPNMPWGQGETPLKPILLWLKANRSPIPAIVEYEYKGTGTGVEETAKCLDFMRRILAA